IVGLLNFAGFLYLPIRPGEPAGANPALDFFVFGTLVLITPYGFLRSAEVRRIDKIEQRLPDFLRDVAEAGRFGMPLPEAIIVASKGRYGLLTEEIKRMASQLEWGVPVATALQLFDDRIKTPLVSRVVSIIIRANQAGGNVADVLSMVAHDAREQQLAVEQRNITMLTYVTVIYISFFVFLFTIIILAAVFLPQMIIAGQGLAQSNVAGSGAVTLQFNFVPLLFLAFFVSVVAHAIGDGIMAGVMSRGNAVEGLQHAAFLLIAGWVALRFFVPQLSV
ncbi:MAG TPA: type II secretion system F family protein, partial [Thermoplasmata archaeon]|nr:type II secretion system F family protein [Thermoplasmata archaeon]